MKLIVGLGNPGKEYASNRHNIGFLVINRLAKKNSIALKGRKFKSRWGKGEISGHTVLLAKPQTFMNLSGEAVRTIAHFYKIAPSDIIVVHDDSDIEFGCLKIKITGGSGGHRGIDSIISLLRDNTFIRIRVGIGRPSPSIDHSEFVLSPFNESEQESLEQVINKARDCLEMLVTHGPEAVMNKFHCKGQ